MIWVRVPRSTFALPTFEKRDPPLEHDAGKLASLSYQVDRTDPGPGAVVTFDGNAKSVLLISDAKTPEEFVRAMRDWTSGSDSQMCSKSINSM